MSCLCSNSGLKMESLLVSQYGKRVLARTWKTFTRQPSSGKVEYHHVGNINTRHMSLSPCSFTKQAPLVSTFSRRLLSSSRYGVKGQTVEKADDFSDSVSTSEEKQTSSSSSSEEDEEETGSDEEEEESSGFRHENLIKLSPLQKAIITVGSGLSSFFDPTRAENIATFGEISAGLVINRLYERMMEDDEGRRILQQKPRINSKTVDLDYLETLPEGTLGWAYIQFLNKNKVTPDSRLPVRFIEDPELAYVMQRYREVHDLVHTVTGQPTNMLGEVVVKWIEGIQTGLPMCVTGGLFGATRLRPKQRQRYINSHLKWAIDVGFTSKPFLYIYYEERWEQSLKEIQHYICPKLLTPPT